VTYRSPRGLKEAIMEGGMSVVTHSLYEA